MGRSKKYFKKFKHEKRHFPVKQNVNVDGVTWYTDFGVSSMLGVKIDLVRKYVKPSEVQPKKDRILYSRADIARALDDQHFKTMIKSSEFLAKARDISDIHELFSHYTAAYYMARAGELDRKFILHVGPTNSGKTHEAIARLMEEKDGLYLAPLRLLALEMFDKMNRNGVPCDLLTGEEHEEVPGANVISSTIELCDYTRHYKVAVIDEAQMIADPSRGAQWTKAICMVDAEEVHICLAPEALEIIRALIREFGGQFIKKNHHRLAPLEYTGRFRSLRDVRDGDCLIVFSRRSVLSLSAELADAGIKSSVIYGALPPTSRREEVRKFTSGETKIVVATDAIGMGVSIPIKRIVFMETQKFDGKITRFLNYTEIRQIAGRAGRYGIYDVGEVAAIRDEDLIENGLLKSPSWINTYTIPFPEELAESGHDFGDLFDEWSFSPSGSKLAVKEDIKDIQKLYKLLKSEIPEGADRHLVYSLITCPVDSGSPELVNYWLDCAVMVLSGHPELVPKPSFGEDSLEACERQYKGYDCYNQVLRRVNIDAGCYEERERLSKKINELLARDITGYRLKCPGCGKIMKFTETANSRYCKKCRSLFYDT
ncbi:MAG: helicase [Lachnospiraceae bacterium]|nr:helicase [Lachnospiraceae bacterium]